MTYAGSYKKISALVFTALLMSAPFAHAEGPQCSSVFYTSTESLNDLMTKRYPSLDKLLQDPNAFYETYRQRFHAQKELTPDHPYRFDFSEMGMPLVRDIDKYLEVKIDSVTKELAEFKEKRASRMKLSRIVRTKFDNAKEKNLETYVEYLKDLRGESQEIMNDGHVSYERVVEFSYFYNRAAGRFDTNKYPMKDRFLLLTDRLLEGYKPLPIAEEYRMYKNRDFGVFQMKSVYKGYRDAEKIFAKDFKATDELKQLWIPTNAALGNSVLMRLMNTKIHLVGVTDAPIWADGYNRPAGDFWMHDVRHESFKYYEAQNYIEKNQLSDAQFDRMKSKMDDWLVELNSEIAKIEDVNLKKAVSLTIFNFHHDAGFPLIPTMFLTKKNTTKNLYTMYVVSGHGTYFENPWKNLDRADAWLKDFWGKRVEQENEALDLARSHNP
ncbi:hypothetical protein [Bdellovibrio sp. NC01]|uniref:hypothetical protein n=1 Tax=Bdellovibrio sp. NC01 TaxID=2220073 RepID=UPI001159D2DC|nr:hypothetical protein [Bdellovibrio sp. NC01]QDK37395.1 hypothetical protein DOE51_07245 [Bdellovibrio sp. NC01]